MTISKVHITGGPGSGKTTLSSQIAASLNVACYELDALALELEAAGRPFQEQKYGRKTMNFIFQDPW